MGRGRRSRVTHRARWWVRVGVLRLFLIVKRLWLPILFRGVILEASQAPSLAGPHTRHVEPLRKGLKRRRDEPCASVHGSTANAVGGRCVRGRRYHLARCLVHRPAVGASRGVCLARGRTHSRSLSSSHTSFHRRIDTRERHAQHRPQLHREAGNSVSGSRGGVNACLASPWQHRAALAAARQR